MTRRTTCRLSPRAIRSSNGTRNAGAGDRSMARIETTRWHRVSALLDILLEVEPGERAARLAEVRRNDPRLANEVALLLDQQTAVEAEAFLEGSAFGLIAPAPHEGESIGSYTLERAIGHGGMGVVWLARRSDGRFEG